MDDQLELLCLCGEKTLEGHFVCKECLEEEMKEAWGDDDEFYAGKPDDEYHDSMDGDHETGLASAGAWTATTRRVSQVRDSEPTRTTATTGTKPPCTTTTAENDPPKQSQGRMRTNHDPHDSRNRQRNQQEEGKLKP